MLKKIVFCCDPSKEYGMTNRQALMELMDLAMKRGDYRLAQEVERRIKEDQMRERARMNDYLLPIMQLTDPGTVSTSTATSIGSTEKLKEWQKAIYGGLPTVTLPPSNLFPGGMCIGVDPAIDEKERKKMKMAAALKEAQEKIKEQGEILERIAKEPLICYSIERLSKDKKFAFVKKGDMNLRIQACPDLAPYDEVLLHPKTMQIVERIGVPPLELSRFAPDVVPNVSWDDIGGLEDAKADMREAVEMPAKHSALFKAYKKTQIKGILLSGPPGCGKTMLGKACATALSNIYGKEKSRTGFLYVKGPEILNCYVGESEKTIRDIFFDAKHHKEEHGYPAVVFIDEADAILSSRGNLGFSINNTIVPMFLTEMDGLEDSAAIVIIATNRPDVLDAAIVRDGRIDRKVTVSRPNQENASKIILMNMQKTVIHNDHYETWEAMSKELAAIIWSSDCQIGKGMYLRDVVNGAMLANCVQIATSFAFQRDLKENKATGITMEDLKNAVGRLQQQCHGAALNL